MHLNEYLFNLQSVTINKLEVCLKDIQRYDANHDPITVNYMVIGCEYIRI